MSLIMSRRGTYRVAEPLPCLFLFKLIYLSALSLTGLSSRPQLIAAFLYYAPSARHERRVHSNSNVRMDIIHVYYSARIKRERPIRRTCLLIPRLIPLPLPFPFFDNPFYTTDRFPWLSNEGGEDRSKAGLFFTPVTICNARMKCNLESGARRQEENGGQIKAALQPLNKQAWLK